MLRNSVRRLAVLGTAAAVLGACGLVVATSGSAATSGFGCRASVLRVDALGLTVEPFVANQPAIPCVADTKGLQTLSVPNGPAPLVTIGPASAYTYTTSQVPPAVGPLPPGVASVTAIDAVNIPSAQITIVGPIDAEAGYICTANGTVQPFASSTVALLKIGGMNISLTSPTAPQTFSLGPLGYIALNETLQTSTTIIERSVDVHLNGIGDVIVGEAAASFSGNPCPTNSTTGNTGTTGSTGNTGNTGNTGTTGTTSTTGTTGTSPSTAGVTPVGPTPSGLQACPTGSILDPALNACVIFINGKTIVVSKPFKGPKGGTVYPLSVARTKFHSPCLRGPGPDFILVATKPYGRVTGTPKSDRILALGIGERVAGLGGDDCIDGKGGHGQDLFDGNGKDRVYGGPGKNRIAVGNGNDLVKGRRGRGDWITAGNGNDLVRGGHGNTRIDVGLGRDHVYGGPAQNRIWAIGTNAIVSCGTGKHNTAFVRPNNVAYARSHGCEIIHVLSGK